MRTVAAVVLALSAVAVACVAAAEPTAPAPFSFYDFLLGEWEVQRGTARVGGEQQFDAVVRGRYFFEKQNGTLNLIGRYYDNDTTTGELTNQHRVAVDFTTPTTGVFKTIRAAGASADAGANDGDEEVEEGITLFAFDFEQHLSNGMALSFGLWNGAGAADEKATALAQNYQFACTAFDRFVITLFPPAKVNGVAGSAAAGGDEVTVYLGRKVPTNVTQTFWQKYGTMIMIGGFFMFNMFVQNKAKRYQAQQQQQARRAARQSDAVNAFTGAAGKKAAKNSTATVEEVTTTESSGSAKPKDE